MTGRLKLGGPLQTEAIGVSFLVAGMTPGALIANFAPYHDYAFHEIEHIDWPLMLMFFLLAGASLELAALWSLGGISVVSHDRSHRTPCHASIAPMSA